MKDFQQKINSTHCELLGKNDLFEGLSVDKEARQVLYINIPRQTEYWVLQMEKRKFQKQTLHTLTTVDEKREGSRKWRVIPWVTGCK